MNDWKPPFEPVLDLADIQGIAVPGFLKPHQTLLYLRMCDKFDFSAFRKFLIDLDVATGSRTLIDRRAARKEKDVSQRSGNRQVVLTAIAFTYAGLLKLVPSAMEIPSVAFKHGMVRRSGLLGDPADPASEGNPRNWVVGGVDAELDAMIVVAGDTRTGVSAHAAYLLAKLTELGMLVELENGDIRPDLPGHEHFGFDDGISQPGIRGRASAQNDDFITPRYLDPGEVPAVWLYGYPGQDLVWPGELILGYPATSPDPLLPGPIAQCGPTWTRNGTFLVYRRLRQDVVAFWTTMRDEAKRLAALPGFAGMTDVRLASLLVGRWPSGAPVARTPGQDLPDLGQDPLSNNSFLLDVDTPDWKLSTSVTRTFPLAKADPAGLICPVAAHIRKVNLRDSSSDLGGATTNQTRRIFRVGIPFGAPLPETARYGEAPDPVSGKRGLLFLSIQTSLEEQFEFLQARWINDDTRPKMPGGHDMIVGQNGATERGVRRCSVFADFAQAQVSASAQFVIPTGGAYLFVPSLSTLRHVIGGSSAWTA
ncbi:Dyp-type peroxidase (plasmid) [Ralstonia solanacearum]|uniref:Dyp-type peroxidase n=1 Tax=Ralstonia solanacearum TaxID=305 RepID=UPI003217DA43